MKLFRIREQPYDMWDSQKPWSNVAIVAENEDDAFKFFGRSEGDKPYYELKSKNYGGKKKPGTKIRISTW